MLILALILILLGYFIYVVKWKIETIDTAFSEDAVYEVVLQSVGEPGWPFGDARGRLVLKRKGWTISKTKFRLATEGTKFGKNAWEVAWYADYVEIILSASRQFDQQFILSFSGKTDSVRLTTTYGKEPVSLPPNPVENVPEEIHDDEYELSPEEQIIVDGYQTIHNIISGNPPESATIYYGAKPGSEKCILFEDDSRIDYLVYDRESKNGNCGLYVRYQCEKDSNGTFDSMNAAIVDVYAYVYKDGSVISSGKMSWSDIGSTEYQSITGEY